MQRFWAAAGLVALTILAFWPVLGNGFVDFDDPKYVTANPHVRDGLSLDGFRWAWTSLRASNWHPLTWFSHQLDWQIFGEAAWGHHLTSLLLHAANAQLLFLFLERATAARWRSAFAAALFAVHPLRVESVAWVAERKDVLSAFFGILALLAYLRYARSPSPRRYLGVALAFALGLAAKPMLVMLPLCLLLADLWPLARWRLDQGARGAWPLVREKIPLLALSIVSGVVTLTAQRAGGAMEATSHFPLGARAGNAVVSAVAYLGAAVWPQGLAVFYPHPGLALPAWEWMAALALLLAVTAGAFALRRRRPYLLSGWLWYLVTLLPVAGILQVGEQARADRYTYLPLVGIFAALAWGLSDLIAVREGAPSRARRVLAAGCAAAVIAALSAATWAQARCWQDTETLFTHAIEVTERNHVAHNNLGVALLERGRLDEAAAQFREALAINPSYPQANSNLGLVLSGRGRLEEAVRLYERAIAVNPAFADAHNNLGLALAEQGRRDEARRQFEEASRLDPASARARNNLGVVLADSGRLDEASARYEEAIRLDPDYAQPRFNLGRALLAAGRVEEAAGRFEEALERDPGLAEAHNNLGIALARLGRNDQAIRHYREAIRIDPAYPEALVNLGGAYVEAGRASEAIPLLQEAIRLRPGYGAAFSNLAAALLIQGRREEARDALRRARASGFEPPSRLTDLMD